MPSWTKTPPTDLGRSGYRLIRTPPNHPLTAYVLSDNLVGCKTHFVGNRTIPCEHPDCEPCNSGVAWRWHGYLAVLIATTQEIVIFECTARASQTFAAYFQRYGTTRGCQFKAERLNARHNGRVLIQARPADLAKINLPKSPPVEKLLCHIWNISEQQVSTEDIQRRPPFRNASVDRSNPETVIPVDDPSQVSQAIDLAKQRAGNNRPQPAK